MPNYQKLPLVEIVWVDTVVTGGWKDIKEYRNNKTLAECKTVGYLTKKSRKEVQVVQQLNTFGDVSDSVTIPRGCVTEIRVIRRRRA